MAANLRTRLGIGLATTAFVSVLVTAVLSVGLLRTSAQAGARSDLRRLAQALASDPGFTGEGDRFIRPVIRRLLHVSGDSIAAVTARGRLAGDGASLADGIDVEPILRGSEIAGTVRTSSGDHVYVGAPVQARGSGIRGVILLRPVGIARELRLPVVARVAFAALIAALVAVGASAIIVQRLVRPVRELSAAAGRITRGELAQSVPVESDDEIGDLARTFNAMSVALREAQRREREFIASVSHELRTPITAIRGYAEALEDGAVQGEVGRAEAVAIIRAESARLERMVQDVMDLARIGAREFRLDVRRTDVGSVLREAVAAHQGEAADEGVGLQAELPDLFEIDTDPDRVRQVVSNLVQNALRVTEAGGSVRVRGEGGAGGCVIEVSDTGPGIAPDDVPNVFERTYLWRASRGKQPVGTGLGLAIVRELVELLGGTVEVSSVVEQGTTFRVMLPARPSHDARA